MAMNTQKQQSNPPMEIVAQLSVLRDDKGRFFFRDGQRKPRRIVRGPMLNPIITAHAEFLSAVVAAVDAR